MRKFKNRIILKHFFSNKQCYNICFTIMILDKSKNQIFKFLFKFLLVCGSARFSACAILSSLCMCAGGGVAHTLKRVLRSTICKARWCA